MEWLERSDSWRDGADPVSNEMPDLPMRSQHKDQSEICRASRLPTVALLRCLSAVGWDIDYLEIDLTKGRPVLTVKCHRADGLWIWARADELGRCTMDRFHRDSWLGLPADVKGRVPQSPQVRDIFLGRLRASGPRSLIRQMCDYFANNALSPICAEEMRNAWRAVMHQPTKLIVEAEGSPREYPVRAERVAELPGEVVGALTQNFGPTR